MTEDPDKHGAPDSVSNLASELSSEQAWKWLREELAPGMRAADHEFQLVTADMVIARNRDLARS